MGSLTSPCGSASGLRLMADGFACLPPYALTPGRPPPGTATLLRLSTSLPTARSGRQVPPPEGIDHWLSITRFSTDGRARVREYQPVVHRLRPTYPGRISLPQEPLVNRRASFSLAFRYSCLHSHSCSLHSWITPLLHPLHDALLPTPALGWSAAASAACLSPVTLSARNHLTSELLRTLSRVAASKPTSWLSLQLHILSHLARAWGP
jgi:hypothetical protein